MHEFVLQELIKSGLLIAKEILSGAIKRKNDELLEEKKRRARRDKHLDPEELARIALSPAEAIAGDFIVTDTKTAQSLNHHVNSVLAWAQHVGFSDLRGQKRVTDIYIELDIYLTPLRSHLDPIEKSQTVPLTTAILSSNKHAIVLGPPGAGKTTSMKKLCALFLSDQAPNAPYRFPLLLRLREIEPLTTSKSILYDMIRNILSVDVTLSSLPGSSTDSFGLPALMGLLDNLRPLVILDGFDEISDHAVRESILDELRLMLPGLTSAKVILTCRSGEFNYNIDRADVFEIAALNDAQVETFVHKWLTKSADAEKFIADVRRRPFADTAIKPLSLAHLCAIYERIGKIPDRPKTVYRKVVGLLLEEWDEQRSVRRRSRYAGFEADRKFEFLSHLAYYLTTETRRTVFDKTELNKAYSGICRNFKLIPDQGWMVVSELESHTGLFVQSAYDKYEFAHKSIQEYLAAEYIVKLPSVPSSSDVIGVLSHELAIATAISSNPTHYFANLLLNTFDAVPLPGTFYDAFVTRIILERPDFYESEVLVLGLYTLLKLWIFEGNIAAQDAPTKINAPSFVQFQRLSEQLQPKRGRLFSYYFSSGRKIAFDGVILTKVEKKRDHKDFRLPDYLLIPD